MRALGTAPAHVHPELLGRQAGQCIVQYLHMEGYYFAKLVERQGGETTVPIHRQFRTVNLDRKAGLANGLVLALHDVRYGVEVGLFTGVVTVGTEAADDPGRCGGHKNVFRMRVCYGCLEIRDIALNLGEILPTQRPGARGQSFRASAAGRPAGKELRELSRFETSAG